MNRKTIRDYCIIWTTLCFTIIVFAPIEIFLSNRDFFWFTLWNVLKFALPYFGVSLLVGGIIIGLSRIMPNAIEKFILAVFGLSVSAYIQGNFVLTDYGQLNGDEIQWQDYKIEGIISVAVWIFTFVIIFLMYAKCRKNNKSCIPIARTISCWITSIQLVTIISLMLFNNPFKTLEEYYATTKDEFVYSENENFIILLLDRFDSQLFMDILEDPDKDYYDIFEDFTFYYDTMGLYPSTDLAEPQILSGFEYLNEETYGDYLTKVYTESPLINRLATEEWDIGIYTDLTLPLKDANINGISNWMYGDLGVNSHRNLSVYMYKLVGFRYLPQALKQCCWFYPDDIATNEKTMDSDEYLAYNWNNIGFYNGIDSIVTTGDTDKMFKYIHIEGAHSPYETDRYLNTVAESTYTEKGRGVMLIVSEYLDKLKDEGIYENAAIVIMSDHGNMDYGKGQSPLLLIKGRNEQHSFQIDDKAVSYEQLQETFENLLDGKSTDELFEEELSERKFFYYIYKWTLEYNDVASDIVEYVSESDAHDENALHETGVIY